VFDSEGYHLDLLVIHLFKRKKTYLRIVTDNKLELSLNAIHTPTNVLDRRRLGKKVKGITLVTQIHIYKKKIIYGEKKAN
jgi:hypothetical protein